ncbi:MAG: AAA family ATPase, partial [Victivallales bacterium]|nr:AAA family ATPase [Victivallales bacterium]
MGMLKRITVKGFKSIKSLVDFELRHLNVIVGANGSGKSNLMQLFEMLFAMSYGGFQKFVLENGESNCFCHNGAKATKEIDIRLDCEKDNAPITYELKLTPASYRLMIQERFIATGCGEPFSTPAYESEIFASKTTGGFPWHVYHFYDTTRLADSRTSSIIEDCHYLRSMGENIAPFLLHLKECFPWHYHDILSTVQ